MTGRIPIDRWLAPLSSDPDLARQEYTLYRVLMGLVHTAFLYGLLSLLAWAFGKAPLLAPLSGFAVLPFYALAYWLGRRGHVRWAARIPAATLFLIMLFAQYQIGLGHSIILGLALATLAAGLLLGAWSAMAVALLSAVAYVVLGVAQQVGYLPNPIPPQQTLAADGIALAVGLVALAILVWLSHREMNRAVALAHESERQAQAHARQLEGIQGLLERQVEERTEDLESFAKQLQQSLEEQQELWETVQRLSIPILPVHEGVIVMPLIGHIDATRAERLVGDLLTAIEEQAARVVILDVTGVPVMDSQVASSVLHTARAARLLGAETILVGVRPDVADTLARLAMSGTTPLGEVLGGIATQRDLQEGVRYALARIGKASLAASSDLDQARRPVS